MPVHKSIHVCFRGRVLLPFRSMRIKWSSRSCMSIDDLSAERLLLAGTAPCIAAVATITTGVTRAAGTTTCILSGRREHSR